MVTIPAALAVETNTQLVAEEPPLCTAQDVF
jgi:hypothetical protein